MRLALIAVAIALAACQGQDAAAKRAKEKLKQAEIDKAEKAKKDAEADAKRFAPKESEQVKLGSPWDDGKLIVNEGACPEGIWAPPSDNTPRE